MTSLVSERSVPELLERAGATLRSCNRADCPRCKRQRAVSFTDELFCCHHDACDFKGNAFMLACELGLVKPLAPEEYREVRQERERADRAAHDLYERAKARRFELLEELRELGRLEMDAHIVGEDHPVTWEALALVYGERPALLAELAILEDCRAADLIRFLFAQKDARAREIEGVLIRGGLTDAHGRFVEVAQL